MKYFQNKMNSDKSCSLKYSRNMQIRLISISLPPSLRPVKIFRQEVNYYSVFYVISAPSPIFLLLQIPNLNLKEKRFSEI